MKTRNFITLGGMLLGLLLMTNVHADIIVFPHMLETSTSYEPGSFNTTITMTYTGLAFRDSAPGTKNTVERAIVDIYLFDDAGAPITNLSAEAICNPCSFAMGSGQTRTDFDVKDVLLTHSAFPPSGIVSGYAMVKIGGSDPNGVSVVQRVVNTVTGPLDVRVFYVPGQTVLPPAK